jgi:outer membrane protein TolC
MRHFGPVFVILFLLCSGHLLSAQQVITLSWDDVIGISREHNLEIKLSQQDYDFQSKNVSKAYGEFLPRLDYQFQAINNIERPEFVIPGIGRIRFGTAYNYTHQLQVQLPVFTGLSRIANLNIQKSLKKSLAEELRNKEDEVVLKALEAYFNLMLANALIDVNQRGYDAALANFEQVSKFYELGAASKLDYLRAKSRLSSAEPALRSAYNQRALAEETLKFTLNADQRDSMVVLDTLARQDFFADYSGYSLAGLCSLAVLERPDLASRRFQLEVADDQKTASFSKFLPVVSLAANVQHQAQIEEWQVNSSDYVRSKSAVVLVQLPLFQGAKRLFDYQQAQINEQRSELALELSRKSAVLQVEGAYLKYQDTRANLTSLEEAMLEAREALRLADLNYSEGIITQVDVLTSQVAQISSEVKFQEGIHEYNLSQLYLLKYIGKLNTIW